MNVQEMVNNAFAKADARNESTKQELEFRKQDADLVANAVTAAISGFALDPCPYIVKRNNDLWLGIMRKESKNYTGYYSKTAVLKYNCSFAEIYLGDTHMNRVRSYVNGEIVNWPNHAVEHHWQTASLKLIELMVDTFDMKEEPSQANTNRFVTYICDSIRARNAIIAEEEKDAVRMHSQLQLFIESLKSILIPVVKNKIDFNTHEITAHFIGGCLRLTERVTVIDDFAIPLRHNRYYVVRLNGQEIIAHKTIEPIARVFIDKLAELASA